MAVVKRKHTISKTFNIIALSLLIVVLLRLTVRIFFCNGRILPSACPLVILVSNNFQSDALASVFTVCGLINFSLPYIIGIRNTTAYSIPLSRVMSTLFPRIGYYYVVYALLVITGLYCSRMGYLMSGLVCLTGVAFSFASTGIAALIYVFNQNLYAAETIEMYLAQDREKTDVTELRERLLLSGDYMHAYFLAHHALPEGFVSKMLCTFEKTGKCSLPEDSSGYFFYTYSYGKNSTDTEIGRNDHASVKDPSPSSDKQAQDAVSSSAKAVDSILLARSLSDRIFDGLDKFSQAAVLRQLLFELSKDIPLSIIQKDDIPSPAVVKQDVNARSFVLLCGLGAWRQHLLANKQGNEERLDTWEALIDQLLSADMYSAADGCDSSDGRFKYMLRLLVLISVAAGLVEAFSMGHGIVESTPEYWTLVSNLLNKYDMGIADVMGFFSWGQLVLLASGSTYYNPEQSYMNVFRFREKMNDLLPY